MALGHCAGFYGRDDVFKALKVQASVLTALRQGWAPMRAQRRGAAQPLDEPPLQHKLRPLHEREFEAGFRGNFKPQLPGAALGIQTPVSDVASHRDLKKSLGFAKLLQERSRSKAPAGMPRNTKSLCLSVFLFLCCSGQRKTTSRGP